VGWGGQIAREMVGGLSCLCSAICAGPLPPCTVTGRRTVAWQGHGARGHALGRDRDNQQRMDARLGQQEEWGNALA